MKGTSGSRSEKASRRKTSSLSRASNWLDRYYSIRQRKHQDKSNYGAEILACKEVEECTGFPSHSFSLQFRVEVVCLFVWLSACLHCFPLFFRHHHHRRRCLSRQSCSQVERSRLPRARQKNCNQFRSCLPLLVSPNRLLLVLSFSCYSNTHTQWHSLEKETNANQFW